MALLHHLGKKALDQMDPHFSPDICRECVLFSTMLRLKLAVEYGPVVGTGIASTVLILILGRTGTPEATEAKLDVSYTMTVLAWPWLVLALNTILTFAIILKIWSVKLCKLTQGL
jgi:hypothetical protein